uniref:Small EDRK-rich factor-like N-terminal domain-containing protein n=1 Tax=Bos mutus grunniens TaxID=30521 RepID=A0A8B9YJB6_BOSMU
MTQGSQQELARQKNKKRQSSSVKGINMLNTSFKKQTILKSSCAPPLCRRWSERWEGMPSLREMQLCWWLRTSPLLLLTPIPSSIRVFSNESTSHEVPKVLEFQL